MYFPGSTIAVGSTPKVPHCGKRREKKIKRRDHSAQSTLLDKPGRISPRPVNCMVGKWGEHSAQSIVSGADGEASSPTAPLEAAKDFNFHRRVMSVPTRRKIHRYRGSLEEICRNIAIFNTKTECSPPGSGRSVRGQCGGSRKSLECLHPDYRMNESLTTGADPTEERTTVVLPINRKF